MNQHKIRAQNVNGLVDTFKAVLYLPNAVLSDDDLIHTGIKLSDLDLLTGHSNDLGPQFAAPFPKTPVEAFFKTISSDEIDWPEEWDATNYHNGCMLEIAITNCLSLTSLDDEIDGISKWFGRE